METTGGTTVHPLINELVQDRYIFILESITSKIFVLDAVTFRIDNILQVYRVGGAESAPPTRFCRIVLFLLINLCPSSAARMPYSEADAGIRLLYQGASICCLRWDRR